ncbi:34699_t:CDS:2, partial [Racocetra persica]
KADSYFLEVAHELLKQKKSSDPYIRSDLFDTVKNDTHKPFEFQHIHGRGLGCIIADEHQGQAL